MSENSATVVSSRQRLSTAQKIGLDLVSHLQGGRDVVLAIDLTDSVGLNEEGRIRLPQIVEDSLKPGDSVYIIPLTVVDINSTAQEFCSPAPGGEETYLLNPYLIKQLWLGLILFLILVGTIYCAIKIRPLQKKW